MIPGHSVIITAWVWAGILGLVFWVIFSFCYSEVSSAFL